MTEQYISIAVPITLGIILFLVWRTLDLVKFLMRQQLKLELAIDRLESSYRVMLKRYNWRKRKEAQRAQKLGIVPKKPGRPPKNKDA